MIHTSFRLHAPRVLWIPTNLFLGKIPLQRINSVVFLYTDPVCTLPVECCSGHVLIQMALHSRDLLTALSLLLLKHICSPSLDKANTHSSSCFALSPRPLDIIMNFFPKLSSQDVSDTPYQAEERLNSIFFFSLRIVKCHRWCRWGKIQWVPCICKPKKWNKRYKRHEICLVCV